jgi:hypothetical protein
VHGRSQSDMPGARQIFVQNLGPESNDNLTKHFVASGRYKADGRTDRLHTRLSSYFVKNAYHSGGEKIS